MSAAPPLAGLAVILAAAAVWELAGARREAVARGARRAMVAASGGKVRSLADAAVRLGVPGRLERSGLADRLPLAAVLVAKPVGAAIGLAVAALATPVAPGRTSILIVCALPIAGFLAPDALLERAARIRLRRLVAALPDALDLLGVGASSGRAPGALLADVATSTEGPLAAEVAGAVAQIECGASQRDAVEALRDRVPAAEVGALAAALERSRRYGSPLAEQLREQASALRREQRRRIEERAARAAPKIQLVVALVLVPSVLLMIAAALLTHSGALLTGV